MALGWAIAGSAGLSALSSVLGAKKAGDAADAAAQGTVAMFERTRRDLAPFKQLGYKATGTLEDIYFGGEGVDVSPYIKSPQYDFIRDEGERSLLRTQAASGRLASGETFREMSRFNQGLASTQFDSFVDRLMGMAGMGQNAAAQTGAFGANAYNQAGQFGMAGGMARAGGIEGIANAGNAAVGNFALLSLLNGGGQPTSSYGTTYGNTNAKVGTGGSSDLYDLLDF
jgi:hypothetical protein